MQSTSGLAETTARSLNRERPPRGTSGAIPTVNRTRVTPPRDGAESVDDWIWQKQLRYYVKGGNAIIKMSSARFGYSYEYQGNAPKLVHTPLTDKCYLTLTQVTRFGQLRVHITSRRVR